MPVVPRSPETQVSPSPVPGVRVPTPPAGMFDYGSGLRQVAGAAAEIYQAEKRRADQVAVLDADNQLDTSKTTLLHDPKSGALTRRGKDALGIVDPTLDAFDRQAGTLQSGLTNPNQRMAFDRLRQAKRQAIFETLTRHAGAEQFKFDTQVTESSIANARNDGLADVRNGEAVRSSIERQQATYLDYARHHGINDETITRTLADLASKTHAGVVSRLLAMGNDREARAYYDTQGKAILADEATPLERALTEGSTQGEAQRRADAAVADTTSRADALAQADTIAEAEVRQRARALIVDHFQRVKEDEKAARDDLFMGALNLVEQTGDLSRVDPLTRSQLTYEQRTALRLIAKHGADEDRPFNEQTWVGFNALTVPDMADLSSADLSSVYLARLDRSHADQAITQWRAARASAGKLDTPELAFREEVVQVFKRDVLRNPSKTPSEYSREEARQFATFEMAASREMEEAKRAKKGVVTGEERAAILSGLLARTVFVPSKWTGELGATQKPVIFVTDDERGRAYVPPEQVPEGARGRVLTLMRSRGIIPAEMKDREAAVRYRRVIGRAYAAWLMGADDETITRALSAAD